LESSVKSNKLTDKELVAKIIRTKESVLFAELYDRYAHIIYNKSLSFVKTKVEAEDITHDIFLKLYLKLYMYKGKSKFSTWLYSFTYNYCVNYVERNLKKRKEKVKDADFDENSSVEITDEEFFQLKSDKLKKALTMISANDKMILLLKYQDDLSIKELESVLNIGKSAVKMRVKRAKEKVMNVYKKL